jgi:hypothetical protein
MTAIIHDRDILWDFYGTSFILGLGQNSPRGFKSQPDVVASQHDPLLGKQGSKGKRELANQGQ